MLITQESQLRHPIQFGNAIWFAILAGLSVLLIVFTIWKNKDLKLVVLLFCLSAIASFLENVIFIWLNSYEYYPMVLASFYNDMVLGAYLSQVLYVSSAALWIAALNIGRRTILLAAVLFAAIECLFLGLGIYKVNWWNPVYTLVGLYIYFHIAKKWNDVLQRGSSWPIRLFTLFCTAYMLYGNVFVIPTFAGLYHFAPGWSDNPAKDTMIMIIVYNLIRSPAVAAVSLFKFRWPVVVSIVIIYASVHLVLLRLHIITVEYGWAALIFPASDAIVLLCCYYANRLLPKK